MIYARIVFAAVFGTIAYFLYPEGIFSVPFSQLTLGKIFSLVGAVIFGLFTIGAFCKEKPNT